MSNLLKMDQQISVMVALAGGSSIRAIERMTGIHRDTIMRLGVRIGQGYTALLDAKMRNLDCNRLEIDEVWGFIGKKEHRLTPEDDPTFGNVWTFCATHAYAWTHETDDPDNPKRTVTVLKIPPATSPETAVRVAIMQELSDAETA